MADDVQIQATVTVQSLTTDTAAVYNVTDNEVDATWTDYYIRNDYEKDGHTYMMGNTSPNPSTAGQALVSFIQLSAYTLIWVCEWTVQRERIKPTIPDPRSLDPNWVFLYESLQLNSVEATADGVTPSYRISGTYYYGHVKPDPRTINNINFPQFPFYDPESFSRTVDTPMLKQGLSDMQRAPTAPIGGSMLDQSDGLQGGVLRTN